MAEIKSNLAAVLYDINDIRIEETPIPEPGDNDVLIQMKCVGICGSDVHLYENGSFENYIPSGPFVMGHEGSGIITKVGNNIRHLKPGDRVAVEPCVPCRFCMFCKVGRYNLCGKLTHIHGKLAQYYCHPADFCYKLPESVSMEEAALLEPLSVGVRACKRAGIIHGTNILIIGAGTMGLVSLLAAKAMGAGICAIADVSKPRRRLALKLGADKAIKTDLKTDMPSIDQSTYDICFGSKFPDVTIDCVGTESSLRFAIQLTANEGRIVVVGMGSSEVTIPMFLPFFRGVDIRGVMRNCNDYPVALGMVASGQVKVEKIITHNFSLEETAEALETAKNGTGDPVKIMIHCDRK